METLEDFVSRFIQSVGCYYHMTKSGIASLKRIDSSYRREMKAFAWVLELKKINLFRIDTYKNLADKAGIGNLASFHPERRYFMLVVLASAEHFGPTPG